MKKTAISLAVASLLTGASFGSLAAAQEKAPTTAELKALLDKQAAEIDALRKQIEATDKAMEETVAVVESDMSKSASKTHVGGYGELHYNNMDEEKTIDLHRFVLFVGHDFSSNTRLFSELEVEHAFIEGGEGGEVAMEQAYIEHDLSATASVKLGMFLMPVGIINETHEPPTFFGVERNPVEKDIIPATWREGGASFSFNPKPGFTLDFAISGGLSVPTEGSKAFKIRSGRQGVSEANAHDLAYTGRIKYTGIPGLELAASYQHQQDITQGELGVAADLFTAHAIYQNNGFGLKALYANWQVDGNEAKVLGRDEQSGYYLEPSFRVNDRFGVFARYSIWDNEAGSNLDTEKKQTNIGFNYWLEENVVLKADIENQSGTLDDKGFNLGVGYQF